MTVEDDGRGFEAGKALAPGARSGLGLLGMQERVTGFGGTFRVESSPGHGTCVIVEVPTLLRPAAEEVEVQGEPTTSR